MSAKVTRLFGLIRDGHEVVDIESDERAIEARLRDPSGRVVVVRLGRDDAYALLFHSAARRSRFLVTTPLR